MKIVRFRSGNRTSFGVLIDNTIREIKNNPFDSIEFSGKTFELDSVTLLPPCVPSKIVCMGLNYHNHAKELESNIPKVPLIFMKPTTAIIGPEENIIYPSMSQRVDYEGELGVIIRKKASHISAGEAPEYILGYTCFNDVTARDLQNVDGQWTRCKGFDTFAPFGPCIETELNPANVQIETCLNGELKQKGNTADLIFPVNEIIGFISRVMTLLPGDIIATGTPSGIGPMLPGDTVEIKIPSIGTLRNHVIKAEAAE